MMTIQEIGYTLAILFVIGYVISRLLKRRRKRGDDPFFVEDEVDTVKTEYIPSFSEEHDSHFEG